MRRQSRLLAVVAAAVPLAAAPAAAQSVLFSGNANNPGIGGPFTYSFVLPQRPIPSSTVGGTSFAVEINSTVVTSDGTAVPFPGTITFYAGGACGGFTFFAGGMNQADVCGPVLFSGPVTAPTFLPGTYSGFTNRDVSPAPLATVQDMTVTVTPEPVPAALAGAGMLGVALLARRRRHQAPSA
jgi:MYXO-CTERM domain-containing protein